MASYTLVPLPRLGITPEGGMLINTYAAGTTTPQATYSSNTGATPLSNPIQADGNGLFPAIYIPTGSSYKFVCTHAITNALTPDPLSNIGVVIWTQDGIGAVPIASVGVDVSVTAGESIAVDQAAYISDGSGSKTNGRAYLAKADNAYSSSNAGIVGLATTSASAGSTIAIRVTGQEPVSLALAAGTRYYVSAATAGALTSTAPNHARFVGQADSASSIMLGPNPAPIGIDISTCEGYLTLTSALAYTTADVTAAGTLFFTPFHGNQISLYDTLAGWYLQSFAEISIAVPAATSQMYDIWCFDSSGTLALELLAWTNDTTRATALTTQNGITVKTGDVTRRYLGSFRSTAVANQTENSFAKRYLYNEYNQRPLVGRVTDPTNSWAGTAAMIEQANAATNQLDFVVGIAGRPVNAHLTGAGSNDAGGNIMSVGIGLDSTTAYATGCLSTGTNPSGAGTIATLGADLLTYPAVGRHVLTWLQRAPAAGNTTFYGDNNTPTYSQSGIHGVWLG